MTITTQVPTVRWYVAPGALPIRVPVELLFSDGWGIVGHWAIPAERLFETEREAFEYALARAQEAKEMWEREHAAILNQIDTMETREVEKEF